MAPLQADTWERIQELFAAAVDLPANERGAFLDQQCGGDETLRREVQSLLDSDEQAHSFIEQPAAAQAPELLGEASSDTALAGRSFGPYEIVREIGRGGLGAVYLAIRSDGEYRKEVAIKLIRRGLDTEDILRRFRNERQILAQLDHPNIARLIDGGTTDDGLPFFVMEYVKGEPISAYCDTHQLGTSERLKLFRKVCSAVTYAHQNLVIHRDLKPSNILVTADGEPKLLDFGIAKLLTADDELMFTQTAPGLRAMTPEYASPEQVRGERITTASDVYSLGVLLYELLTGQKPYRLKTRTAEEVSRAITDQEPERPSTALAASADSKINRPASLSSDLDNIVLMALRKEPHRRYASVGQFSEDVRRYLEGLPVVAHKDTIPYRATKFIQRHKVGVAAAAVIALTLVGGIIATGWQAKRATEQARIAAEQAHIAGEQARIAAQERDRARVETAKAERINAFLQNILGTSSRRWVNPNPDRKQDATIKEALDEASRRAQAELGDQPEVLAAVLFSLGKSYLGQSKHDVAESHLRSALEIRRRVLGPEHQDTAISLTGLSEVLGFTGKLAESESLAREAIAIFRRKRETGDVDFTWFAIALNNLGTRLTSRGDPVGGEQSLREALEVSANLTGAARAARVAMLGNLGMTRGNQGDIDGGIAALQAALEESRSLPGSASFEDGVLLGNLAVFLIIKGEYAQAEPVIHESLEKFRQIEGGRNQYTTWSLVYLADNYYLQGDYRRAREEIDRAIELQRQVLPEGHIDFGRSWTVLGKILTRTSEPARGEEYLRNALALRVKAFKPIDWRIAATQGALGECLAAQNRMEDAAKHLHASYDVFNQALGANDPRTRDAAARLVTLYETWDKPDEAERYRALAPASK